VAGGVGAYFNVKFTKERTRESIEKREGGVVESSYTLFFKFTFPHPPLICFRPLPYRGSCRTIIFHFLFDSERGGGGGDGE
jgi:hypothetical protein